jgi:hypothetical protein
VVPVPSLSELRAQAITGAVPSAVPALRLPDETPPAPDSLAELIAPMQLFLRTEHSDQPDRRVAVMAALTPEAIWIQDTWQLRSIPLQNLGIERRRNGKELVRTLGPEPITEKLTLAFANATQGERWCREVQLNNLRRKHASLKGTTFPCWGAIHPPQLGMNPRSPA